MSGEQIIDKLFTSLIIFDFFNYMRYIKPQKYKGLFYRKISLVVTPTLSVNNE
jgi:hypothetical protein